MHQYSFPLEAFVTRIREEAVKEERTRILKLIDWRRRPKDDVEFQDGDDVIKWIDEKLATLTTDIQHK